MTHQLGSPLPGASHYHRDVHDVDDDMADRMARNCPRVHPWCSVAGCTERPLRQFTASSSKQVRSSLLYDIRYLWTVIPNVSYSSVADLPMLHSGVYSAGLSVPTRIPSCPVLHRMVLVLPTINQQQQVRGFSLTSYGVNPSCLCPTLCT